MNIIKDLFLIYIVTQLLTTAYGLTVISTLKPIIEERLKDRGYEEKNKNSLYVFNDKIKSFLLGLIPFYYGYKGLKLIQGKDVVNRAADEEIVSGNWITPDEQRKIFELTELEQKKDDSLFIPESQILFEKPEPYKARPTDYSIYDLYQTPIEYAEQEMNKTESTKITPFSIQPNTQVLDESKGIDEVNVKDVARYIGKLDMESLDQLSSEIDKLKIKLILGKEAA